MRILLLFVLFTLLSVMAIQSNDKTKVNLLFHGAAEKYSQSIGGMKPLETKSMLPTDESLLNSFIQRLESKLIKNLLISLLLIKFKIYPTTKVAR